MTRLLSTYLTIFHNTDLHIHTGITNYIKIFWLKKRPEKLIPTEFETKEDIKNRDTLTFRQFVNFMLYCPDEIKGCDVSIILARKFKFSKVLNTIFEKVFEFDNENFNVKKI